MNDRCGLWLLIICLNVCTGRLTAADLSKLAEADRQQVNAWMSQRAELLIDAHRVEREVQQAWTDTSITSPELEKLRARYRELEQELNATREAIRKKVLEAPAMQAKARQFQEARDKAQALSKKIAEKTGE